MLTRLIVVSLLVASFGAGQGGPLGSAQSSPSATLRAGPYFTDVFPPEEFAARRRVVMDRIGDAVAGSKARRRCPRRSRSARTTTSSISPASKSHGRSSSSTCRRTDRCAVNTDRLSRHERQRVHLRDDGRSFDYRPGQFARIDVRWDNNTRRIRLSLADGSRMLTTTPRAIVIATAGEKKRQQVRFDGKPIEVRL